MCWNTICDKEEKDEDGVVSFVAGGVRAPCPVCRTMTPQDDARVVFLPQYDLPKPDPAMGFGVNDLRFCLRYTEPFDSAEQVSAVYPASMVADLKFVRISLVSGMTDSSAVLHARQFIDTAKRETLGEFRNQDITTITDAWERRKHAAQQVLRVIAVVTMEWTSALVNAK